MESEVDKKEKIRYIDMEIEMFTNKELEDQLTSIEKRYNEEKYNCKVAIDEAIERMEKLSAEYEKVKAELKRRGGQIND